MSWINGWDILRNKPRTLCTGNVHWTQTKTLLLIMWCILEIKPKPWNCTVLFVLSMLLGIWGCSSVDHFRLLPELRSYVNVMLWWFGLDLSKPNHGDVMICSMMDVFTICYCFPISLWEVEVYVYEIPDLTIFESSISYIWFSFQSL